VDISSPVSSSAVVSYLPGQEIPNFYGA